MRTLTELDTAASDERDPALGDDNLTLLYTSGAAGAFWATSMHSALRQRRSASFDPPNDVSILDSADVAKAAVAVSNRELVISAEYDGGTNNEDLWTAERAVVTEPFSQPVTTFTGALNNANQTTSEIRKISPDELVLLYTERSTSQIAMSLRATVADSFVRQGVVTAIDQPDAHDAAFSRDGCELVFSSTRDGSYDLFVVTVAGVTL